MIDAAYTKKIEAAAKSLFEAAQQHLAEEHRKTWESLTEGAQRDYMREANKVVARQKGPSKIVTIQ